MKISQLSESTGASIRSIRHYEKKNLITASRLENGYRDFDESAVDRIKTIQLYLGLGFTTNQIEEMINCVDTHFKNEIDELCDEALDAYEGKLAEINRQISNLGVVQHRLKKQINQMKQR
ncbi:MULTISPECIES: MerR family transcriptional regulator [unclassified Paenibacillus]|uniref:MerR family transcriptional regulator n=1 Tax=unclassified Paenibacillus TaxID=185978 RepID=UPI001C0FA9BB|nr:MULTISPECIES: MerR family transcriptional regulator [unclassified Paenibacillus]MBU5444461.1 MerR family transcriptional regulator [Paenibacillus sp. MSJ-34]CAH0121436.1 Mercuric resistance operon regulatory protein [Paenibacillus sp. CECT 9249]